MRRFVFSLLTIALISACALAFPLGRAVASPLTVFSQQPGPLTPAPQPVGPRPGQPQPAPPQPAAQPVAPQPSIPQQAGSPAAAFVVSVAGQPGTSANGRVHDALAFDASSSQGAGLSYWWDFGDGGPPVPGQKVTHSYGLVDDYAVSLTIVDRSGQTLSTSQSIRIIPLIDSLVSAPPLKQIMVGGVISVLLYVQAPGLATIDAHLTGDLISGKPVSFSTGDALAYAPLTGQVANETNPSVDQSIIQKLGGSIPLQGNVGLELTYQTSAGKDVDLNFVLGLQKDRDPSKGVWAITYPNFSLVTGTTDTSQPDVNGYYMKGDPGFHHPDDPLLRKYALQAARAGGALSDDPAKVTENLYTFAGGLFGSDDPAQIEPDTVVVQKIAGGTLVPGQKSEKYICISQTYFLSSLARTMGLPSRELTIALANPVSQRASGAWTVDYVQEGATEVWFDNAWHLYDTWMGIRNLDDYLARRYAYQAWYSYSTQNYNMVAKNGDLINLYGHDFAIGEQEGSPAAPEQWYLRQRNERTGIVVDGFPTS